MDLKDKIVFVGTGGGGSMVGLQELSTGGMWWNIGGFDFYVDPGPATVWHLRRSLTFNLDLPKLKAIFISHTHADHIADLNTLVEAHYWSNMVSCGQLAIGKGQVIEPKDMVPGSLSLLLPNEGLDKDKGLVISKFHQTMLANLSILAPQTRYKIGGLELLTTKTLPEKPWYKDVDEYGFWISHNGINVGYVPETFHQPKLFEGFKPKVLILNVMLTSRNDGAWEAVIENARDLDPKLIIIRHFSSYAVRYGRENLAKELTDATGVPTQVAYDFSIFDLKELKWA